MTLAGIKEDRAESLLKILKCECITSYEMCLIVTAALKKFSFEYIVIDEASILSQIVRTFIDSSLVDDYLSPELHSKTEKSLLPSR